MCQRISQNSLQFIQCLLIEPVSHAAIPFLSSLINFTHLCFVSFFLLVSGSSSSHSGSELVSPASPSTISTLSSPLSSPMSSPLSLPSSPVFTFQSPTLPPPKSPSFCRLTPAPPPPTPTKTRTHSFCQRVTLRQLSSNCNHPLRSCWPVACCGEWLKYYTTFLGHQLFVRYANHFGGIFSSLTRSSRWQGSWWTRVNLEFLF